MEKRMEYRNQVQCANCYCTLYWVGNNSSWGITGELCYDCQKQAELEEDDYYD